MSWNPVEPPQGGWASPQAAEVNWLPQDDGNPSVWTPKPVPGSEILTQREQEAIASAEESAVVAVQAAAAAGAAAAGAIATIDATGLLAARDVAVGAQEASEFARDESVAARVSAIAASVLAGTYAETVAGHVVTTAGHVTASETARDAAGLARDAAVTARNDAQAALATIDSPTIVRVSAQLFTAAQKLQARTNLGAVADNDVRLSNARDPLPHNHALAEIVGLIDALAAKLDDAQATVFGLSLLSAVNATAARSTLGQTWRKVADILVGVATSAVDIPLDVGFSEFKISAMFSIAGAADSSYFMRTSVDGITYASGASEYFFGARRSVGNVVSSSELSNSFIEVCPSFPAASSAQIPAKFIGTLFRGDAGRRPALEGKTSGYFETTRITDYYGLRQSNGAINHIRFQSSVAGAIGVGSRFIVEGC